MAWTGLGWVSMAVRLVGKVGGLKVWWVFQGE